MPTYSLTEIETHCRKAARGAGYEWGEAEEAGKAARWLCASGIDGAGALLALLQTVDGQIDKFRPTAGVFAGETGQDLCGLTYGCAVADRGLAILDGLKPTTALHSPLMAYGVICNALPSVDKAAVAKILRLNIPSGPPRKDVDCKTWDGLNTFACRTYVPATEESRLKGAG